MGKPYPKSFRESALVAYASNPNKPVSVVAKDLGISPWLLSTWAQRAGIGRNKAYRMKKRKAAGKRSAPLKAAGKRSALDGSLRIVAELVTAPGLNNNQRINMIAAYLSAR